MTNFIVDFDQRFNGQFVQLHCMDAEVSRKAVMHWLTKLFCQSHEPCTTITCLFQKLHLTISIFNIFCGEIANCMAPLPIGALVKECCGHG